MTIKFKLFLALITLSLPYSLAQAKESLFLTTTDRYGDCVHSAIFTKKSQFERDIDKKSCTNEYAGNKAAIAQCLEITNKRMAKPFYSDCGNNQNYIGINNKTYQLNRTDDTPTQAPFLVGDYQGYGITVQIKKIRLLKREPDIDNAEYYEALKYEVLLIVTKGKTTRKIKGVLDEGI